ncbi:unnamed protein product, partial [Nesidiocoris tenuis]
HSDDSGAFRENTAVRRRPLHRIKNIVLDTTCARIICHSVSDFGTQDPLGRTFNARGPSWGNEN